MSMRIVSKEVTSMVYHRPECRYVQKIDKKNRVQIKWEDAEWKGYRPCQYCDGAEFLYSLEFDNVKRFAKQNNMNVNLKDAQIYVRTDVGCWKIVYKASIQRFILLHRNYVSGRIGLEEADNAPFHRQEDMPESGSIIKYLKYIKNHDEFKQNMPADYRQLPRDTKKQKAYYESAKRREEKRNARRLDDLFALIESKEEIKEISFC